MAFGNKKLEKQDLIDAGLDPDKLKEFQEKGVTKDDLVNMETKLTTTVTDLITNQFKELEGRLTARSSDNGNGNGNGNNNNENGNGNNNEKKNDLFDIDGMEFATDPGTHLRKISTALVNDSRVGNMAIRRENAWERLSSSLQGFKNDTIRKEIEDEWVKYTPQIMVNLGSDPMIVLRKLHDASIGAHYDDIQRDRDKKDGKFNLVQTGGSNRTSHTDVNNNDRDSLPADQQLTAQELSTAKSFGMSAEEWLKSKKSLIEDGKFVEA